MYCASSPIAGLLEVTLILLAFFYSQGWRHLRKDFPNSAWRLVAFLSGLASIACVWATPLAHLDHHSLTAHMLQHLVLMTVAAPLILLGEPGNVLLGILPRPLRQSSAQPFHLAPLRALRSLLAHPTPCWFAGTGCVILWHVPALFELGMRSGWWHGFEHLTFLAAGLLFWWPVVQPSETKWARWSVPLYLFLATLPCDALSAFLTFCGRVVYSSYVSGQGLFDSSALRDQEFAGAMMWVWVTFVYLAPAVIITIHGLSERERPPYRAPLEPTPLVFH
jgi:cytochrome c oxidase assembly factor CtaG